MHSKGYTIMSCMRDIVFDNPSVLPALSRFSIPLGFGESTVGDVCRSNNVDAPTLLAVINYICGFPAEDSSIDLPTLINYLKSAHDYFLAYILPSIRAKLITAITTGTPGDFTFLFVKLFDQYVDEVRRHLLFEETEIFPHVRSLVEGKPVPDFSISRFKDSHTPIVGKLGDMKELFIGHFTAEDARVDMLNTVLFDIIVLERDLTTHCHLEDDLFIPAVIKLEHKIEEHRIDPVTPTERERNLDENGDIILTPREREIVTAIALGLSNKEIADRLCLSIHTVTTHRRNISAKLNIHSSSAITLFALMHGLITLDDASRTLK